MIMSRGKKKEKELKIPQNVIDSFNDYVRRCELYELEQNTIKKNQTSKSS